MRDEIELLMECGFTQAEVCSMDEGHLFLLAGKVINDHTLERLTLKEGLPFDRMKALRKMTTGELAALRQRCV